MLLTVERFVKLFENVRERVLARRDESCYEEFITPGMAAEYLGLNDPDNRDREPDRVMEYRQQMEAGQWGMSQIGFSYFTGDLIDGQHRMAALAGADVEGFPFTVQFG